MDEVCARRNSGLLLQKMSLLFQSGKCLVAVRAQQELTLWGRGWGLAGGGSWQIHRVTTGEQSAGKQSYAVPVPEWFCQLYTSHNSLSHLDCQLLILDIKLQFSRDF